MEASVLVFDFGSSKVHVNIISESSGAALGGTAEPYPVEFFPDGSCIVEPESVWQAAQTALERLLAAGGAEGIKTIGMAFFGDSVIPVDGRGESLFGLYRSSPAIMSDRAVMEPLLEKLPDEVFSKITGSCNNFFYTPATICWLRVHHPDVYSVAERYYSVQQYILQKMGFRPLNDYTSAGRRTCMDSRAGKWSDTILGALGLDGEQLGDIAPSASIVGEIDRFGRIPIPRRLTVTLGAHDAASATIGMGVAPDGSADFIANTAGSADMNTFFLDRFVNTCPEYRLVMNGCGVTEGTYYMQCGSETKTSVMWYLSSMLHTDDQRRLGEAFKDARFDGTQKVWWDKLPLEGDGAIRGITPLTTQTDIFTALIERLTFPMRWNFEHELEPLLGRRIRMMRIGSGGAKEPKWIQLKADLLGIPVEKVANTEVSSVGAAIIALTANGTYSSYAEAINALVHVQQVFSPDKKAEAAYNEKYLRYAEMQ